MFNWYAPPQGPSSGDPQFEIANFFNEIWVEECFGGNVRWFGVGDSNEEPGDSLIQDSLTAFNGTMVNSGSPTRWEVNAREVDWGMISHPELGSLSSIPMVVLSDHKLLWFNLDCPPMNLSVGQLKKTHNWKKPEGIGTDVWRQALEEAWQALPILSLDQLDQVQLLWDEYMHHLDLMYQEAISTLISQKQLSNQEGRNRIKGSIPKGSAPVHVTTFGSKKGSTRGQGSMKILKLRKKLARLYQMNRLLCCTHGWKNHEEEVRSLTNKLGLGEPSAGLLPVIHSQIMETKELLSSQVQETRKVRLKTWKENLRRNPGAMGRWIKAFDAPKVQEVTNGTETSADNHKVVHFIKEFWNSFWEEGNQLRPESMLDTLVQHAFVPNESINWQPPSLELLVQTARTRQSGSAGPDGWAAEEIRHLPELALAHFRALAIGWETQGVVPQQLLISRMVNLPKMKNSSGPLMVDQIRPITILNCFWRLWASAWIRTDGAMTNDLGQ